MCRHDTWAGPLFAPGGGGATLRTTSFGAAEGAGGGTTGLMVDVEGTKLLPPSTYSSMSTADCSTIHLTPVIGSRPGLRAAAGVPGLLGGGSDNSSISMPLP